MTLPRARVSAAVCVRVSARACAHVALVFSYSRV
jgi:hypothetical protein